MSYPLPKDEELRIESLRKSGILDTSADARFDTIVDLTQKIFDVPVCLISFVDEDRQWFKSCYGVDVKETSRNIAFCNYTILTDEVFEVPDAALDDRFKENPLVTGLHNVRYYSGAPIISVEGFNVGTLCIIDTVSREPMSDQNTQILRKLASMVSDILAQDGKVRDTKTDTVVRADYFAQVSHELRTPLNAIVGVSNIMQKELCDNEKLSPLVDTLCNASTSMMSLMEMLMDTSALASKKLSISKEKFFLNDVWMSVLDIVRSAYKESPLSLVVDIDHDETATFYGDAFRIKQVVLNLLTNAYKYTDEGSVELKVTLNDELLKVVVTDTGIGLSDDNIAQIFDRYTQIDKGQKGGVGLGLSISKQLTSLMGGELSVESVVNKGSSFTLTLPRLSN